MKHSKLLIALLSMLPLAAFAQDDGAYIGAGLGFTDFSNQIEFLDSSDDGLQEGYRLFVGYDFNPNWSAELGYTSYGESDGVLLEEFPDDITYETSGIYLNGSYHWNFAERWSADFLLGLVRVTGETQVEGETCDLVVLSGQACESKDKAWGINAGVGATFAFTEHLKLRGAVDFNQLEFDDDGSDSGGNLESNDLFEIPYRLGLDLIWKF